MVDTLQFFIDDLRKVEGIEGVAQLFQLSYFQGISLFPSTDSLERGLRLIVNSFQLGAHTHLAHQLDRREEEVLEEPQLVTVEFVHRFDGSPGVIALVAEQFADMSPVLLLDVGIVILFIRSTPGELNLVRLAVAVEVSIDKFRTVVRVNSQQLER